MNPNLTEEPTTQQEQVAAEQKEPEESLMETVEKEVVTISAGNRVGVAPTIAPLKRFI